MTITYTSDATLILCMGHQLRVSKGGPTIFSSIFSSISRRPLSRCQFPCILSGLSMFNILITKIHVNEFHTSIAFYLLTVYLFWLLCVSAFHVASSSSCSTLRAFQNVSGDRHSLSPTRRIHVSSFFYGKGKTIPRGNKICFRCKFTNSGFHSRRWN